MKSYKWIFIVVLVIILIGGFVGCFYMTTEGIVTHNLNTYKKLTQKYDILPTVDELGEYSDIQFNHLYKSSIIFQSNGYTLKVKYNDDEFIKQKNIINQNYAFQDQIILYGEGAVDTQYKHDEFDFKMLSLEEYNLNYPKYMIFVGISDKTNQIAYIIFEDQDLDFIDDPWGKFFDNECGW